MPETVESVFVGTNGQRPIPDTHVKGILDLIAEFQLDKEEVKSKYVELLNNPGIAASGDSKWEYALASVRGWYNGLFYGQGTSHEIHYTPLNIGNRPFQDSKKGTYTVRVLGSAIAASNGFSLRGPANVQVTGLLTEEVAKNFITNIQIGKPYKIRGNPSAKAPSGDLAEGQSGFLYVDGNAAWEPYQPTAEEAPLLNGGMDALAKYFPHTLVGDILSHPTANQVYRIQGPITRGRVTQGKDNTPLGVVTVADNSVTGELAKQFKGGLFLFLPSEYAYIAALPSGSIITALVSGYESKKTDAAGNPTGDVQWRWSVIGAKVVVDLSAGTAVPNPTAPAVSTTPAPTAPKRPTLDL